MFVYGNNIFIFVIFVFVCSNLFVWKRFILIFEKAIFIYWSLKIPYLFLIVKEAISISNLWIQQFLSLNKIYLFLISEEIILVFNLWLNQIYFDLWRNHILLDFVGVILILKRHYLFVTFEETCRNHIDYFLWINHIYFWSFKRPCKFLIFRSILLIYDLWINFFLSWKRTY